MFSSKRKLNLILYLTISSKLGYFRILLLRITFIDPDKVLKYYTTIYFMTSLIKLILAIKSSYLRRVKLSACCWDINRKLPINNAAITYILCQPYTIFDLIILSIITNGIHVYVNSIIIRNSCVTGKSIARSFYGFVSLRVL